MARKTRGPLTLVGTYHINFDGQIISCTVKRSTGAKYARLEVRQDIGLIVVIPKFYKIEQIQALLETKKRWILSKLARCRQSSGFLSERELKDSDTIPYLGQDLEVRIHRNNGNICSLKVEDGKLLLNLTDQSDRLNWIIVQWYRKQAAEIIKEKVDKISNRFGLTFNRISIRSQRTRWGSCSYNGNLNFNWKLIMAPEPVVDYVVIHELMHLEEMNHTSKFWKLVAELCPRWREHKKWLREHETELAMKLPV